MARTIPALLVLLSLAATAAPLAAATHTDGATCTPWAPTLDGRERYCVNPTHPTCPVFVQHRGTWLSYDACFPPSLA